MGAMGGRTEGEKGREDINNKIKRACQSACRHHLNDVHLYGVVFFDGY